VDRRLSPQEMKELRRPEKGYYVESRVGEGR
jgi:hypothetical protein